MSQKNSNIGTTKKVTPKVSMFKCQLKVAIGVYIGMLFVSSMVKNDDIMIELYILFTIFWSFILLSICTYRVIQSKNYSLIKKIGVWIWDSFISLLIIGFAINGAERSEKAIDTASLQGMELHCNTQDVQVDVSHHIENILIKNDLITLKNAKSMKITLSDIQELKKINDDKLQTLECRARVKISKQDYDLLVYTIDYNASLNTKGRDIQFQTNVVLLDPSL